MRKRSRTLIGLGLSAGLLIGGVLLWNHLALQRHMDEVLGSDPRNNGIEFSVHYEAYLNPSAIVVDLTEVDGTKTPADIFRVVLQFAAQMVDRDYTSVKLARQGETRFLLEGTFFRQLGREYGHQNPVYTMRTFPENLLLPDGTRAFGRWEGGLLGVLPRQMEDFNEFVLTWLRE